MNIMSPLRVEIYRLSSEAWQLVAELTSDDPNGSISDNLADGTRNIYMFGVAQTGRNAFIARSIFGLDVEYGSQRAVDTSGFETIALLKSGESYEMEVMTDRSPAPRKIRFSYSE
jgi:hypothetical protein